MSLSRILLLAVMGVFFLSCSVFKKSSRDIQSSIIKLDTIPGLKDAGKENKLKSYKEIITAKAVTDTGLFTVHRIDDHYFFELPDSQLNQDVLVVSRIAKAAAGYRPGSGGLGYAGDQIGEKVIRFIKGPDHKLFIKLISFNERSADSSSNGMYQSVYNSTLQPIAAVFDIKAYTSDSAGLVIDVTDFIKSDNNLLYFDPELKKIFTLGGWQKDKSYIEDIKSFPVNLELQTVNTYTVGDGTVTYELNTSFVLLPKKSMQPRYYDERVGYFSRSYTDFDSPKGVENVAMITRWRLEPKDEDIEKYLKGELVEPKKPIVYYIDPGTPKKWVPYLIQGVNDWQKAFEKAGFKNAIYALEAPTNDSTFSLFDARHNAIIYKPSVVPNASGPHVHDPRTGEILETHINWYHNVISLIHDWYLIQAGPNDPRAQKLIFDDSLMGQLIRFVSSHEVGHTLGLMHNFLASSTIPVDSLRSKKYVEANGFCPSIMDYARFNYVAQPEDSISERGLMPRIGAYDEWAVEWGYRWLPQLKNRQSEKTFMNRWIIERLEKDKRLQFATTGFVPSLDPRVRMEDLGDDAMKAGYYGIENLKRIVPHILKWTTEPGANYSIATRMQTELVFRQYYAYISHVLSNIAGLMNNAITREQKGVVYAFPDREKQRSAIQFLQKELFTTPTWFIDAEIFPYAGAKAAGGIRSIQIAVLYDLLSYSNFDNMLLAEKMSPGKAYRFTEMLEDLEAGIWKELDTKRIIDTYRRDLQKAYAERLISLLVFNKYTSVTSYTGAGFEPRVMSDFYSIAKAHIKILTVKINNALPHYKDELTRWHLIDLQERLQTALNSNPVSNILSVNTPGKAVNPASNSIFFKPLFPCSHVSIFSAENVIGHLDY